MAKYYKVNVNFGGYIGCDNTYEVYADDEDVQAFRLPPPRALLRTRRARDCLLKRRYRPFSRTRFRAF